MSDFPNGNFGVVRLNANGSRDTAFVTQGFEHGVGAKGDRVAQLLPAAGGRIYVGGTMAQYHGEWVGSLVRLNPDGSRDATFARDVGWNADATVVEALASAADGTDDIYVGGRMPLWRLKATGAVDPSFEPAAT